jgi:hypothetical protein
VVVKTNVMQCKSWCLIVVSSLALGGCAGGATPEPESAETPADDKAAAADGGEGATGDDGGGSKHNGGIPSACARQDGEVCLPPKKFVDSMCADDLPTVALALFAQGTPWTRAYVTDETEAWNASGGGSSNEKMKLDEEVLVLRKRDPAAAGGMQVSGNDGSYDVLRWDGACVTLHPTQLRFDAPRNPANARIIWKRLEMDVRDWLQADSTVRETYVKHKKACKGVTFGDVSKDCVKLDEELSETVAAFVRGNGGMPTPKKLPD